jgi:hypothetical protein
VTCFIDFVIVGWPVGRLRFGPTACWQTEIPCSLHPSILRQPSLSHSIWLKRRCEDPRSVAVLRGFCFSCCNSLKTVKFESHSHLDQSKRLHFGRFHRVASSFRGLSSSVMISLLSTAALDLLQLEQARPGFVSHTTFSRRCLRSG